MASTPSQSPSRPTGPHTLPMSGEAHAVDESAPSDARRHTNDTGDNANDDDGTGESLSQGVFDLASIRTLLPRQNYSAHPNIKLLPGLDFGIPETAPFTSQQMSGLVAKILLPSRAAGEPPSAGGQFDVASRICQIIVVAADVYHTHDVFSLRVIFDYAFRELRNKGRNWNFVSAARKSSFIMEKILEARKRFIANGYDTSKIQPCFLHFLNALDDFTRIVEGGLKAKQLKINDATTLLNTSRKRTGNHLSNKVVVPWKVHRSHHDDCNDSTETADDPLGDDEMAVWRAKGKSLEASLALANKEVTEAKEAVSRNDEEWSQRMKQLWTVIRSAVNDQSKSLGGQEWEEDEFDQFLWKSELGEVASAVFYRQ